MKTTTVKSTPKDVFLQLFNIFVFYLSIIGFITLYIAYISASFPDPLNYYFSGIANTVRVSSSMILIAVPAYIFTAWLLNKDILELPAKRDLKLRKWLLYFTLFLSAITIAVDLMIFIYNFLSGELTAQFFLKILVVMLVAAGVFSYYIWDLKRTDIYSKVPKYLAYALGIFTLASFVIGLFVVGTPATQRNRRFDEQRVTSLQYIQDQVINYWADKRTLPAQLTDLENSVNNFIVPTDPETKLPYSYTILTPTTFELCATFTSVSEDKLVSNKGAGVSQPYYYGTTQNWSHNAELTCFTRTIDPERVTTKYNSSPSPIACTTEAMICPDGSAVGRTGLNCEFASCPGTEPSIVGGDKDAHGCIGSAGYTWCESKQKCLRTWEEKCDIATTSVSPDCPAYSPPSPDWCKGGTVVAPAKDINGCVGAPTCIK